MKSYYECKRCFYKCYQKNDMMKHLKKKTLCTRSIESFNFEDSEIHNLSLIRTKDNANLINNNKMCTFCNKVFSTKNCLLRHIEKACKKINNDTCTIIEDIPLNIVNENSGNSENILNVNENITQNITNNIVNYTNNNFINVNINLIKSFDEEWDDSKIDDNLKIILLLADSKYTKTLENLLQNDVNLNVLIDNTGDTGLIYKKNNFEIMNIKDIVEKSMEKIYNQLNKFHKEIKESNEYNIKKDYLEEERKNIESKYKDYKLNSETKNKVMDFIKDIYNKKKDDTIKICNDIVSKNTEYGF